MKKIFSFTFIALFFQVALFSQTNLSRQFDNNYGSKGIVYNKEFTIDARLHTFGFAIAANFTKIKTYNKSTYFQIEIGELKTHKDFKQSIDNNVLNQASRQTYFFGKKNNLYVLRAGYGKKKYLSEKAKRKGVAIGLNYEGGVTLGLLKPYYLDIRQSDPGNPTNIPTRAEKYNPEQPCNFLDPLGGVHGSSGFFKGLGEVKPLPGIHFKAGIHFDWGAFDEFVKAIEVGIMADVFIKRAPILIHIDQEVIDIMTISCPHLAPLEVQPNPNRPFFINLYVTLQLGKRW